MEAKKNAQSTANAEPLDLVEIFKILPPDAMQLRIGFAFLTVLRVWLTVAITGYLLYIAPWYLLPFAWVLFGTASTGLFVLGHECAHRSFTRNRIVNEIVGTICMMPLLFPYNCWELTHNHHHAFANHMDKDHLWRPLRPEAVQKMSSTMKLVNYYFYGPLFFESSIFHQIYNFLLPVLSSRNRFGTIRSDIFALIGGYLTVSFLAQYGSVFKLYVVPFLVFQFWLSTFTYFHHKHPKGVGWKEQEDWTRLYGSLFATVHVDYPAWVEYLTLDINWHLPHHVSPSIPWYNLRKCTYALFKAHGDKLQNDVFGWKLWQETTTQCHLYDKNGYAPMKF